MQSLLDQPSPDACTLAEIVAEGFNQTGVWPIRQFVFGRLSEEGLDGEAVLQGLSRWGRNYELVTSSPRDHSPVALTVYGMEYAPPLSINLVAAFLAVLAESDEMLRNDPPRPDQMVSATMDMGGLLDKVNVRARTTLSEPQLREMLDHEPATSGGVVMDVLSPWTNEPTWTWDPNQARLGPFRRVATSKEYLAALQDLLS